MLYWKDLFSTKEEHRRSREKNKIFGTQGEKKQV